MFILGYSESDYWYILMTCWDTLGTLQTYSGGDIEDILGYIEDRWGIPGILSIDRGIEGIRV